MYFDLLSESQQSTWFQIKKIVLGMLTTCSVRSERLVCRPNWPPKKVRLCDNLADRKKIIIFGWLKIHAFQNKQALKQDYTFLRSGTSQGIATIFPPLHSYSGAYSSPHQLPGYTNTPTYKHTLILYAKSPLPRTLRCRKVCVLRRFI